MGSGTDDISFSSTVSGDLDFSKLSSIERLNLSGNADTLTISGDEPTTINGLAGNDQFTLDFSTVRTLDGGNDTDTVKFTGATSNISADTDFTFGASLTNIEKLDITGLSLNTSSTTTEFNFTDTMIKQWSGSATGTVALSLTSAQTDKIMFTDSGNTVHDTQLSAGTYDYTLKDDSLDGSTTLHLIVS
jgi:hypothetical protein